MISKLDIHDFKCLHKAVMSLESINVITGKNSSGKSSVIQALNLMSEHLSSYPDSGKRAKLVAGARQIRPFSDYKNLYVDTDRFILQTVSDTGCQHLMTFMPVDARKSGTNVYFEKNSQEDDQYVFPNIYHLPASRQGNLDTYKMNGDERLPLGREGEYVIDFLYNNKDIEVAPVFANTEDVRLMYNLDYWLKELTGYTIAIDPDNELYKISFKDELGNKIRPSQVGTGVGFLCAILIVCMCAETGSLIAIENPEIHLHPGAQAKLCEFLSRTANSGRQLLIESHSDHIINGLLIQAKKQEYIHNSDLKIYFFDDDEEVDYCMKPYELPVSPKGKISNAPKDFFDQIQIDLRKLLDIDSE